MSGSQPVVLPALEVALGLRLRVCDPPGPPGAVGVVWEERNWPGQLRGEKALFVRRTLTARVRLSLGPGFRLGARWNRLGETVKTRKKRGKAGKKWARYSLRSVKDGS